MAHKFITNKQQQNKKCTQQQYKERITKQHKINIRI